MPKLPEFTADPGNLHYTGVVRGRPATAEDVGGGAAAGMVEAGGAIAGAGTKLYADWAAQDQRDQLVGQAQIREKYSKALQDAQLSGAPIDPIRQQMENDLTTLRNSARTNDGFAASDLHAANTMTMFNGQAQQIAVQRAGDEAKAGATKLLSSNAKILLANPTYLPVAQTETDTYVDTFKGKLPPARLEILRQELQQHNTVNALTGQIYLGDPAQVKQDIETGKYDLTPEARAQLLERSISQTRANKAQQESDARYTEWQRQQASDQRADEYTKDIFSGSFKPREAVADPQLTKKDREHLMVFNEEWWRAKMGQERKSDQNVLNALLVHAYAPAGDPNKVYNTDEAYDALKKKLINATDFNKVRVAIADQRDPNNSTIGRQMGQALNTMQHLYSGPLWMGREAIAANIVNSWFFDVRDKIDAKRREGGKGVDPSVLFDPHNPDYVMSPAYVAQFVKAATGTESTLVDLRQPNASWKDIPVGVPFIDPQGTKRTMTKELLDHLAANPPTSKVQSPVVVTPEHPYTPSGETPEAQKKRAEEELSRKYNTWGNK